MAKNDRNLTDIHLAVREASRWVTCLRNELSKVIVGQRYMIDRILVGLLSGGHILIEGVPGLGKTLAVKSIARAIYGQFNRIQFTPDMLPSDITGNRIFNPQTGEFTMKKGPVFAHMVLADEVNRAPAKVQSALLECMQEQQITVDGETFLLPELFLVLATENPVEHEGTYPLPESQIDRFLLKLRVEYPSAAEELLILQRSRVKDPHQDQIQPVVTVEEILQSRELLDKIFVDPRVEEYIVNVVRATREPEAFKLSLKSYIHYGASPRATCGMLLAAKAFAFLQGRGYVTPQDVKSIGMDVLRHRIIVSYAAEVENVTSEVVAAKILNTIPTP